MTARILACLTLHVQAAANGRKREPGDRHLDIADEQVCQLVVQDSAFEEQGENRRITWLVLGDLYQVLTFRRAQKICR